MPALLKRFLFVAIIGGAACVVFNSYTNIPPTTKPTKEILYGKDLIARTAYYFGPKGKLGATANGMNCQNCHNAAGTKAYGLNLISVAANFPRYMPRTDEVMSIAGRINGCFQRSLNGKALDTTGKEMKAMIAYIKWLGKGVQKGQRPEGTGVVKLAYLDQAADPEKGKVVYVAKCQVCHGVTGAGVTVNKVIYVYPPLWGNDSYNDGAGLYRITTFAGFVKNNMPFGATYKNPRLTDEEAWNVAAFVNSQPRPHFDQHSDWKDINSKPIDFPFGPYVDEFSEQQHKFGPFKPIADLQKKSTVKKS